MKKNPILIMDLEDSRNRLHIEYISEEAIPQNINGESGFHIYHVRMLTELILRQLVEESSQYNFSEDEIITIATASSLHDIGKTKIPKSILEYPGKLSAVQFDIVKKHSQLGEDMILGADCSEVSSEIVEYARQIARWHHERYDGTGYPDGLKEENIPIYAQAVSLADAYDALTSKRNYKQAFSQDVALQMISSGMCGVFQDEMVENLIQVVNHKSLVELREKFVRSRTVVTDVDTVLPKNVLLLGNTEYVTEEFIENAFPDSKVIVLGNKKLENSRLIKVFRIKKPTVEAVFETYDIDAVVYFSRELTYSNQESSDAEYLRETLEYASKTEKKIKFVYLSSLEVLLETKDGTSILVSSKEKICDFYGANTKLDMKILQIPYLYSSLNDNDFLHSICEKIYKGKAVRIKELPGNKLYFMSMTDLADLMMHLFDNWSSGGGIMTVGDEFGLKFSDFAEELSRIKKNKLEFVGTEATSDIKTNNRYLRNQYGWFARVSIIDDLNIEYEKYIEDIQSNEVTIWDRIKGFLKKHEKVVKIVEMILMFLLTELLIHWTNSAVIFAIVDFRMAYIVIMAITYGLRYGLSAALLCSISWLVAKVETGTNLMTIFYEPTNWLAFVYYFLVAALCGYVKIKAADDIRFVKEENNLLEDKLVFTREIYDETYREKRDLKKQIIGSKDSFGKIFDITRKLDAEEPRQLYLKIIETFENVLENKSVTVYSVNEGSMFGRLEVASTDIINDVARSISLDTYRPVVDEISKDNIWKNTEFITDLPMYGAGIKQDGKLVMLIFIWQAEVEQQTLYYMNLFKILKDLVQMSMLRALKYNQAIRDKQYLPNTEIMISEAFEECLNNYRQLAEKKVSSCLLMEIITEGKAFEAMYNKIKGSIRSNDILGIDSEGKLCVLLTQASIDNMEIIKQSFEKIGVKVELLQQL